MAEIVSINTSLIFDPFASQKKREELKEFENKKVKKDEIKYSDLTDTDIQEQIKGLTVFGETQIFKIIRNNDDKYSKNGNGIFFNLSKAKSKTRQQIINFLLYCKNYEFKLKDEEKDRNEYKKSLPEDNIIT